MGLGIDGELGADCAFQRHHLPANNREISGGSMRSGMVIPSTALVLRINDEIHRPLGMAWPRVSESPFHLQGFA